MCDLDELLTLANVGIERGTPPAAFGRGFGRRRGGAGTQPAAGQVRGPATMPALTLVGKGGYSLFDFEMLKD